MAQRLLWTSRCLASLQTALGQLGDWGWEYSGLVIKGLCALGLQGLDPFLYYLIRSYNSTTLHCTTLFPILIYLIIVRCK